MRSATRRPAIEPHKKNRPFRAKRAALILHSAGGLQFLEPDIAEGDGVAVVLQHQRAARDLFVRRPARRDAPKGDIVVHDNTVVQQRQARAFGQFVVFKPGSA